MSHLDLDYADGHISPPLEPTPDDQGLVNDVIATRPNGGEARATLESGPLSVQDPPDGVGRYERQLEVNVDSDSRLPDVASWALHHGTWDDPHDRFPLIRTNLRRLNAEGFGLLLTGVSGDYANTPDKAALDVTGDIDIRADLTLDDWFSATPERWIVTKYEGAGNQRSFAFGFRQDDLEFRWSTDGTSANLTSINPTAPVPVSAGRLAVRVTLDVDDGAGGWTARFYTAPTIDGPWSQLGDPVTNSGGGTTSIHAGTATLAIGAFNNGTLPLDGIIHSVEVRDGIDGTLVADLDFAAQTPGTTQFIDGTGNTWTIAGDAQIVALDYMAAQADVGDRLTIQHPPEWLPPDDIDQYVLGYAESIAVDEWTQDWHTTPAGPFYVLAWQDETTPGPDAPARFDTDGSETVGTFSAGTDTSLEVLTTRGPLWTQDAGDLPFHVRTSGVVLNVTGINAAVRDTFSRTVSNGWGVADSGQQWTLIEGAASDASVGSGVGTLDGVIMGVGSYGDVEVLAKVTPGTGADGSVLARITDQGAGNWAYYEVALDAVAGHVGLWIRDDVAEFYDEVAIVEMPIVAGTSYWCRMRVRGHQISFKVWPDGSTEPTSWATYQDTDQTVDEGAVGLATFFGEAEFDDFAVVNPQRFTVDQTPVNGVEKTVPAGSPLRLATPAAFGL